MQAINFIAKKMNKIKRVYSRVITKKDPPTQYRKGRVCKKRGCKEEDG